MDISPPFPPTPESVEGTGDERSILNGESRTAECGDGEGLKARASIMVA